MNRKRLLIISSAIIVLIIAFFLITSSKEKSVAITTKALRGPFEILVYSTGQLSSENTDNILIPEKLNDYTKTRISYLTITDMVEEGTYVDSGEYVATLDYQAVQEQLATVYDDLESALTAYEDSKIDSNLTLSNHRDQITNARLDLEERKIAVQESAYETPSEQRKVEMDLDKAQRKLDQTLEAYRLVTIQEANKVDRKDMTCKQIRERVDAIEELGRNLVVNSPRAGIVTYYQYPSGGYVQVGASVGRSSPIIATFPNMNHWVTKTFINEIDISLIEPGQKVKIGVDAFPEKELKGEVVEVANIGLIVPQSDAKAFEVKININDSDKDVKPGMTTSNTIQAGYYEDVVYVPIESVFSNDSLSFVYLADSQKRQIIEPGDENENYVIVHQGISEGQEIYLNEPEDADDFELTGFEIYTNIQFKKEQEKANGIAKSQNKPSDNQDSEVTGQATATEI